jgi:S-adenosylmethionine:tRNA-ribosyltransferase-isomerase (queuine synthetase)
MGIVRRKKKDVAADLPDKLVADLPVEHELGPRLLAVGPAEEAPDGVEVLDVVDQRRSRQGMVVDEAHFIKNLTSQRSQNVLALGARIREQVRDPLTRSPSDPSHARCRSSTS